MQEESQISSIESESDQVSDSESEKKEGLRGLGKIEEGSIESEESKHSEVRKSRTVNDNTRNELEMIDDIGLNVDETTFGYKLDSFNSEASEASSTRDF